MLLDVFGDVVTSKDSKNTYQVQFAATIHNYPVSLRSQHTFHASSLDCGLRLFRRWDVLLDTVIHCPLHSNRLGAGQSAPNAPCHSQMLYSRTVPVPLSYAEKRRGGRLS